MAGFPNLKAVIDAENLGRVRRYSFRKTPAVVSVAGIWFDMSMSPGNPVPNYYANTPLIAATLDGREGLFHGGNVAPLTKHLRETLVFINSATGLPLNLVLCDYLLYYPFIDQGDTDPQVLDNSTPLPRYADGAGVQIMPVLVGAQTGGQSFTVSYTNQDGTPGRTTPVCICNTATFNGALVSSQTANALARGPFLALEGSDSGVRSIESVTMLGADVGLLTFVLVKPLANFILREQTAPVEVNYVTDRPGLPEIKDGAYLNLLCCPQGSLSGVSLHGILTTTWS
jgi:hypothetical protein